MNDIWRGFNSDKFFLNEIRKVLKEKDKEFYIELRDLVDLNNIKTNRDELFGIIENKLNSSLHKRTFIDGVMVTENYFKDIALEVYRDFPEKLRGMGNESEKRELKLMNVILDSFDKEEMLAKITEEKIRSLFYGNPLDFFKKDTAKLGLKKFFSSNHQSTLDKFTEIIARRNIYVHNDGRVDRKYHREVKNSTYSLGNKAIISDTYLRESLMILKGLGVLVANLSIRENYHIEPNKRIQDETKITNKRMNN